MIPLSSDDREGPNGFRFKYTAQGSGMANGISEAKDASWILP